MNAADAGDTIKVKNGVYREAVRIDGRKKRYLKLVGNPKKPGKVVLEGNGKKQNGIAVNDADEVSVSGFKARHYRANGFFFTNLNGYTMNHLVAQQTGVYGLYAFNTIGGRILNSEAYYVNDGAFYIGQTPPQDKPKQTIVRNVEGWGSPIGFSASNMRYVTITKSRFYNNAVGIVPERARLGEVPAARGQRDRRQRHLLEQPQLPRGQPAVRAAASEGTAALVPLGTGILLLGGREHRIENNRIYGNFLTGDRRHRRHPAAGEPAGASRSTATSSATTSSGSVGTDANGRDIDLRRQRQRQLLHARAERHDVPRRPLDDRDAARARTGLQQRGRATR